MTVMELIENKLKDINETLDLYLNDYEKNPDNVFYENMINEQHAKIRVLEELKDDIKAEAEKILNEIAEGDDNNEK